MMKVEMKESSLERRKKFIATVISVMKEAIILKFDEEASDFHRQYDEELPLLSVRRRKSLPSSSV